MLKSHVKFHSTDGKRIVLIVDDEQVNRELLGFIVSSEYEPLYAESGEEAMRILKENAEHISLVLLDLMMPGISGFDVLRIMRNDEIYSRIPVMVMTAEEKAEVECLKLGASDFIVKPFNMPEVIMARIQRTIELYEDRDIIQSTEREPLTGLFIKNYFYRYAEQYDRYHANKKMDALALDISHFRLINEMYGRKAGDEVLRRLGAFIRQLVEKTGGMACRLDGDKFQLYLPNGSEDYEEMLARINEHFVSFGDVNVRVRGGVYINVDKSIEIERRFDRATHAAGLIKGDYSRNISYYDAGVHEKEIYSERLIADFDAALEEEQFIVYYQPKYDIRGDEPRLTSAEALVRWKHPELGMISPGVFIPLFEKNGLIQRLDYYIWKRVAEMLHSWKEEIGAFVPVSVNVSRVDLYRYDIVTYLQKILAENALTAGDIYLEITESAYTENPDQITAMLETLRGKGFKIEMDDFGTGYSSLNMLADVTFDILKLDMKFVQNLGTNEKQEKLVRMIMDLAGYLSVTVVAEGVEEKDQADFLKEAGCAIIQGYYFSKPLPAREMAELIRKSYGR